jgi:hypothetical protein
MADLPVSFVLSFAGQRLSFQINISLFRLPVLAPRLPFLDRNLSRGLWLDTP